MRQLGWVEGRTVAYDRAYAGDRHPDLPRLASELVARKPEVIYAPPTPAALAAKEATQTIPIVFGAVGDPVRLGLVNGLAHPAGNVTGISNLSASLFPKRVELLREILPSARRLGVLSDPTDSASKSVLSEFAPVAASRGLTIIVAEAANPADFDAAVAKLITQRADVIFGGTILATNLRGRLIELAGQKHVPVIASNAIMADAGALFAYGTFLPDLLRRSALLVDKILKGTKPADIAVEQPTLFELVVNLKVARALGIAIPRSFLLRADRVIE
jgi:putative ABC transport system substrate-binding protein